MIGWVVIDVVEVYIVILSILMIRWGISDIVYWKRFDAFNNK